MIVQVQVIRRGVVVYALDWDSPTLAEYNSMLLRIRDVMKPDDSYRTVGDRSAPLYVHGAENCGGGMHQRQGSPLTAA